MRYWDSSAIVPLVLEEAASAACRQLLRADRTIVVWTLTRTEVVSALRRKQRAGQLNRAAAEAGLRWIDAYARHWTEVDAIALVRDRAERLLGAHDLRAADALQLAAALVLVQDRPKRRAFVTLDDRLAIAAEAEGFDVLTPT